MSKSPLAILQSGIECWNRWRAENGNAPCSLAGQDLSGGYFFEGNFRNVDLSNASLQRSCCIGADFTGANLENADLSTAYIDRANFDKAILAGIDITGTNLSTTNLRQALSENRLPPDKSLQNRRFQAPVVRVAAILMGLAVTVPSVMIAATLAQRSASQTPNTPNSIAVSQRMPALKQHPAQLSTTLPTNLPTSLTLVKSIKVADQVWAADTQTQDDGRVVLASGDAEGTVQIWDGPTGEALRTLHAHNDMVRSVAISPSGERLVSSSGDGIKVWQLQTGELLYSLPAEPGVPIWTVAVSSDGKTFVSGDYAGNIRVWEMESGMQRYSISVGEPVWSIAIAPDSQSFVSGSDDNLARHWDLATGALIQSFSGHTDTVRAVAISPDGKALASGSWDSTINLWDLASGELTTTLQGHSDRVVSLAISPDGKTLASSSVDSTLKLWDTEKQQLVKTLDNSDGWVLTVAFDPLEHTLVSGGKNKQIKLWQ